MAINYMAILVAGIAGFILGFLWYSPLLFGNLWIKLSKFSKKEIAKHKKRGMKGMWKQMSLSFLGQLIRASALAVLLVALSTTSLMPALRLGALVWFGFLAVGTLDAVLWEGKSWKLLAIKSGHELCNVLVMAAVLVAFA
jgi:hypothetical protein